MVSFILNNIKYFFDALIVVGAIVLFAFFDPFGWFDRTPKIENTPVSIKSIRQIGEIITAEYYGEVVESLKDTLLKDYEDTVSLNDRVKELFIDLKQVMHEYKDSGKIHGYNLYKHYDNDDNLDQLRNSPFYEPLMGFLVDEAGGDIFKLDTDDEKKGKKEKLEKKVVLKIFKSFKRRNKAYEYKGVNPKFSKFYKWYRRRVLSRKNIFGKGKARELVLIGRGWVKAGISFEDFTESNLKYHEDKQEVHLFNVEPKILDYDMNPWFIPEKKVQGFVIVRATAEAKNPRDIALVKKRCKERLREQALERDIIGIATVNAEKSLRLFFSVLIGKEIKKVVFHVNKSEPK